MIIKNKCGSIWLPKNRKVFKSMNVIYRTKKINLWK